MLFDGDGEIEIPVIEYIVAPIGPVGEVTCKTLPAEQNAGSGNMRYHWGQLAVNQIKVTVTEPVELSLSASLGKTVRVKRQFPQ